MNLVIDQGNTAIKIAVFDGKDLIHRIQFPISEIAEIVSWINQYISENSNIIHASVGQNILDLNQFKCSTKLLMNKSLKIPIENVYRTPETLGQDRIANACALSVLAKNKNALCIDLGTCIKYDFVNNENQYLGGAISPGLNMRFQSMHDYTAKLPFIQPEKIESFIGADTKSSLLAGVMVGIEDEINGFINRYSHDYSDLTIFMTGGDANHFDKGIKKPIFVTPDLTLIGLNEILQFNIY